MLNYKTICFLLLQLTFWSHPMARDRTHTEVVNGVKITFSPKYEKEQESFHLHGVLTKDQTEILKPALPAIAEYLSFLRHSNGYNPALALNKPRTPREFISERVLTFAANRTHSWHITEDAIRFVTDYNILYGTLEQNKWDDRKFRDAHIFRKINGQWVFYDNFGDKPYGFLKCKHSDKSCKLDPPLW
jgi:hypothetical protein